MELHPKNLQVLLLNVWVSFFFSEIDSEKNQCKDLMNHELTPFLVGVAEESANRVIQDYEPEH